MACEVLDLRCIFVNELVGSSVLAVLLLVIIYFIAASKLRLGLDTTLVFLVPFALLLGLTVVGFSTIFAVATIVGGLMLAWIFGRIIGNR